MLIQKGPWWWTMWSLTNGLVAMRDGSFQQNTGNLSIRVPNNVFIAFKYFLLMWGHPQALSGLWPPGFLLWPSEQLWILRSLEFRVLSCPRVWSSRKVAVHSSTLGSGSTPYYSVWFSIFLWRFLYVVYMETAWDEKKIPVVLYFHLLISREWIRFNYNFANKIRIY